jgi:ABC-2 type transport system permease protein
LLGALIIIYLLNFRYLRAIGEGGIIGPMGLFVMNLGLCGFVVAAVGARFLFPAISLEGRGFWVLKASPQPMRAILVSKWVAGGLPLLLMSELLTVLSNLLIGAPWPLALAGLVIVASMNAGISGLAVGMGALFPRFDIPPPPPAHVTTWATPSTSWRGASPLGGAFGAPAGLLVSVVERA